MKIMIKLGIWVVLPLFLSSCPEMAYIEGYNNTDVRLAIDGGHDMMELEPRETGKVMFTGDTFHVSSELGSWSYERTVPNGGENGEYFDGTLSVQINRDGSVYSLKRGDRFPVDRSYPQPVGYPIFPR